MKITNNLNLPDPVVRAVAYDDYEADFDADISVTTLIGPSMIRSLRSSHADSIEMDAADMIFSLTGKAVHEILRRSNVTGIAEERLRATVGGKTISGQFDHLALDGGGVLSDYKETSVWSVIYGNDSWEKQLNIYSFILAENNYPEPEKLQIVAFLRDHQKSKAKHDPQYPKFRVHIIPVKKWTRDETISFILSRLKVHFELPPTCTDEERWKSDDTYAVMKTGRKSAMRVLPTLAEAEAYKAANGGTYIEKRSGEYRRCAEYCDVSKFCPIYRPDS